MKAQPKKDKKLLFLFPHQVLQELPKIMAKEKPTDQLYGAIELQEHGWDVNFSDDRHLGLFGRIHKLIMPYGINLINYSTIKRIMRNDVIIVKDNFSLMTTLVCRLLGKKIIYKDAMFRMPKRFWKKWSVYINLRLASAVICYSKYQARRWEERYKLRDGKIKTLHYSVDMSFYPELEYDPTNCKVCSFCWARSRKRLHLPFQSKQIK